MARAFYPPFKGRLRVVVTGEGEVLGVGWRAWVPMKEEEKGEGEERYREGGRGDFDVVVQARAPGVWVDKAIGKGKGRAAVGEGKTGKEGGGGEEEEEEGVEKSFLQK